MRAKSYFWSRRGNIAPPLNHHQGPPLNRGNDRVKAQRGKRPLPGSLSITRNCGGWRGGHNGGSARSVADAFPNAPSITKTERCRSANLPQMTRGLMCKLRQRGQGHACRRPAGSRGIDPSLQPPPAVAARFRGECVDRHSRPKKGNK